MSRYTGEAAKCAEERRLHWLRILQGVRRSEAWAIEAAGPHLERLRAM